MYIGAPSEEVYSADSVCVAMHFWSIIGSPSVSTMRVVRHVVTVFLVRRQIPFIRMNE